MPFGNQVSSWCDTETNWDSISKAFSTAGRVVNDAEVVYTVLAAAQADHEMIQDLLGLLDSGTSLYNGLKELDRYQKHSIGSMASTMVKNKVFDEITGLMEDQGVGRLASLIAGTGGIETGGAVFIANLGWKVVAAGAHKLGVADTDELFTAMAHISNQYALDRALTRELIKISDNYIQGRGIPVAQLKAEYALLYRCYLVSIKSAVDDVAAVSTRASLTKEFQSDWSKYGRHLTYENYIASCLASARTQWQYKTSGGKATITGMSNSGSARAALKASSHSDDAVSPVDIPPDVDGVPVTAIAPGAFSGMEGLSCISVPDSVATIGESAFEGAAGLEAVFLGTGVRDIGASSFAGCDALADIALPASLESIGEGAFTGGATRLRPQEGTAGASACGRRGGSHVDVFYGGCSTQYPIEITADSCAYAVSYVDQAGLKVADDATGQGTAGTVIELEAPEVAGYSPVERSKTVTIEPNGRYAFEYAKDALPSVDDAEVEIASASYTGQRVQPEVAVRYGFETLVRDRDYYMEYGEIVDAGTGLVLIGGYGGVSLREFTISPIDISSAVPGLSQASYTYDGAAKAVVKGEGSYTGTASAKFSIGKAKNAISVKTAAVVKTGSVRAANVKGAKAKVAWAKMAGADKYQVRVALDARFTKGKKTYNASAKLASKTTGKLEKGKAYYVQVRAFDKQTGSWGAWSAAKKVKIGK